MGSTKNRFGGDNLGKLQEEPQSSVIVPRGAREGAAQRLQGPSRREYEMEVDELDPSRQVAER